MLRRRKRTDGLRQGTGDRTNDTLKGPDDRRSRVLRAGTLQVLWALLLVYFILAGLAFLFGREVGYDISFGVCGGLSLLVTVCFALIHLLDRTSAEGGWMRRIFLAGRKEEKDLTGKGR